ncbi:MAG: glycosyltransferase [Chloroflexi bacterium]|nr:glycosyltransferase [Chloroflexota bacterium]
MILFVSGEYPPDIGGLGDYTARLRLALEQHGWLTDVVTRRHVRHWDIRALLWLLRNAPRTGVVHIQYQAAAFDLLGDICLLPTLLHRIRPSVHCITTFHDVRIPYLFPRAGRLRRAAVNLLARTSDAVIAADSRDLRQLGGPSPRHIHVPIGSNVPCAPPADHVRGAFRANLGLTPDDLAVAFFGTLNASKGIDLLLSAFEAVQAQQPQARLLLLGGEVGASDATDRRAAAQVQARLAALGSAVIGTGWLPPERLSAYLLAADVALLPYADGASARRGSLLACAAHGLPLVTTQPTGVEVAPYVSAVRQDPVELAEAVSAAWRDSSHLRAASTALADSVSWPRIAAQHIQIYERLLYSRR